MTGDARPPRDPKDDTDVRLLSAAAAGDQPAWEQLYQQYRDTVYRWCRTSGLPREDAEDVGQEVFWCVHTGFERFDRGADGSFRGWLSRICGRRITDHQRIFARRRLRAVAVDLERLPDNVHRDPADLELAEALQRVRGQASQKTWALFAAFVLQDRTAEVVAREWGVSRFEVYHARTRIFWMLRRELGRD